MPAVGVAGCGGAVVMAGLVSAGLGWLGPGVQVGGRRVPGQESVQVRAGQGLPAVVAAGVEVGGEVGQDVQASLFGGRGDGPDGRGEAGGVVGAGAVPGTKPERRGPCPPADRAARAG